jgi:hypothetical protein
MPVVAPLSPFGLLVAALLVTVIVTPVGAIRVDPAAQPPPSPSPRDAGHPGRLPGQPPPPTRSTLNPLHLPRQPRTRAAMTVSELARVCLWAGCF